MKRVIYGSTSGVEKLVLYHGTDYPHESQRHIKDNKWLDLGMHAGSEEQARSHGDFIMEVEVNNCNLVRCEDLNDWNNVYSVARLLSLAGLDIDQSQVTNYLRESGAQFQGEKSAALAQLLVENGIDGCVYQNMYDEVKDTSYCIFNMKCISSFKPIEAAGQDIGQAFDEYVDITGLVPTIVSHAGRRAKIVDEVVQNSRTGSVFLANLNKSIGLSASDWINNLLDHYRFIENESELDDLISSELIDYSDDIDRTRQFFLDNLNL